MLIVVLCVQMHDDHRDGAKEKSEQENAVMYSRNCLFALHAYTRRVGALQLPIYRIICFQIDLLWPNLCFSLEDSHFSFYPRG